MDLTTLLVFIAIIAAIYYLFFFDSESLEHKAAIRNVKPAKFPNIFKVMLLKQRFELLKDQVIRKEGKVLGCKMLGKFTIVIAVPELVGLVLSKEYTNFPNRRDFPLSDPLISENLIFAKLEQWKRLRSIITPTFSTGKIRQMKPFIDKAVKVLVQNLNNMSSDIIDCKLVFGSMSMDAISQIAFGVTIDSLNDSNNPIIVNARKMFSVDMSVKNLLSISTIILMPKLGRLLGLRINAEPLDFFMNFVTEIIAQKKEEMEKVQSDKFKAKSFIELMIEAEEESKHLESGAMDSNSKPSKYMNTQELVSMALLFYLAGHDTTASTLTLTAYNLAVNPDIQEQCHHEIVTILKKFQDQSNESDDPYELITLENLSQFEFLTACINETLRLDGSSMFTEREASRDILLQSEDGQFRVQVKKGDIVHVPTYSLHHDEEQFPSPNEFKPERFLGQPTFHNYSFIPFSAGPKNCVARSLATMEVKLALIHVLRHYRLVTCPQTKIPCEFYSQGNILQPKDVMLKFEKR